MQKLREGFKKEKAVIQNPRLGYEDHWRKTVLFFDAKIINGPGASQMVYDVDEFAEIIKAYGIIDIKDLEGNFCYVQNSDKEKLLIYLEPCVD